MGWFLTKKGSGKKTSGRRKKASKADAPSWDPARTVLALKGVAAFAVLLAVIIGWRYGEQALMRYVSTRHAHPVAATDVDLVGAGGPVRPVLAQRVAKITAEHVSGDPLDGQSLRKAAQALQSDPWVKHVRQVRRVAGGQVQVDVVLREPAAVVVTGGGYRIVDGEGVWLPEIDRMGLPVITGVNSPAPRSYGQRWRGSDLDAGLALVAELRPEPYAPQIAAYDVSDRDARGRIRLVLYTETGAVRWGLPPGQERSIEPAAAVKRQRLRQVLEQTGTIDAGGRYVSVNGPAVQLQPVLAQPGGGRAALGARP